MRRGRLRLLCGATLAMLALSIFCATNCAASEEALYKKALVNAMENCYKESELYSSIDTSEYTRIQDIISGTKIDDDKIGDLGFRIPTKIGSGNEIETGDDANNDGTKIGCYQLFMGDGKSLWTLSGSMDSIFKTFGKTTPNSSNNSGFAEFIKGMGYTELNEDGSLKEQYCVSIEGNMEGFISGSLTFEIGKICYDAEGLKEMLSHGSVSDAYEITRIVNTNSDYEINPGIGSVSSGSTIEITYKSKYRCSPGDEVPLISYTGGSNEDIEAFMAEIASSVEFCNIQDQELISANTYPRYRGKYIGIEKVNSGSEDDAQRTYSMASYGDAYKTAYKYFTGSDGPIQFEDDEKFELYSLYLDKVYNAKKADGIECVSEKPASAVENASNGDTYYNVYYDKGQWCKVTTTNGSARVSAFTADEKYKLNTSYDFEGLVKAMFDLDIDESTVATVTNPDSSTEEETETEASCYDRGGSLGWIFCPIIESASSAIQDIYSKFIEPFLVLETDLFSGNNGTYNAWNQFRNIANIIFVIFFVVVIFSQLTGIGIDNYGIKKILPKLIVGAILINLSYIICQLAIDIANIVGYSVGGLFQSMGEDIDYGTISLAETGGETLKAVGSYGILTALIALITTGAILSMGVAILVPVLMAVISVLCAIFFCFVLLGVRKAFAVILVVVSPLAFACYMLPNTQPIFKKWYNAFKGVLLAFPICSAMIYGGQMVARIMVSASDNGVLMPFVIALSAAVISVVPIFMIPKVLSSSMAAISGITGRIAGMQKGLTGRAQGKFDKSGAAEHLRRTAANPYKLNKETGKMELKKRARAQDWLASKHLMSKQRLAENRERAVYDEAKRGNVVDKWGGENGLQRAQDVYEGAAARREAEEISDIESRIERSDDINNVGSLQTKLADAIRNGDTQEAIALKNVLYRKGENGRNAVGDAIIKAQGQGANQNTLQRLASHAMSNDTASLKANARSQYEFMKETAEGGEKDYTDYKTIDKAQKFTAENMATMDDKEINSMIESISDGSASADQKAYAQRAAYDALHNDNISLKGERRTQLEQLAAGYAPADGGGTDSGNADANAGGGSETNAGSGTNTVEHKAWSNLSASEKTRLRNENPRDEGESTTDYMNRLNGVAESTGGFLGGAAPNADGTNGAGSYTPNGHQRAAEGNWFDYYPRQKGESNEQYKARIQHMKDMTKAYQAGYESGSK